MHSLYEGTVLLLYGRMCSVDDARTIGSTHLKSNFKGCSFFYRERAGDVKKEEIKKLNYKM